MQRISTTASVLLCIVACSFAGCTTQPPYQSATETRSSDPQLANEVSSRLSEDSMAGRFTFGITVRDGVVTIQGSVPDEITRTRVIGIVRGTPGVQGVVDRLYRM